MFSSFFLSSKNEQGVVYPQLGPLCSDAGVHLNGQLVGKVSYLHIRGHAQNQREGLPKMDPSDTTLTVHLPSYVSSLSQRVFKLITWDFHFFLRQK